MKRVIRWIFGGIVILLWLVMMAVIPDTYWAYRWSHIVKSNRYVLSMPPKNFMPDLDNAGNPLPSSDSQDIPYNPVKEDVNAVAEKDHLGNVFEQFNEADRTDYARLMDLLILMYARDGANLGAYGKKEDCWWTGLKEPSEFRAFHLNELPFVKQSPAITDTVARIISTDKPECIGFEWHGQYETFRVELFGYPMHDVSGSVNAVVLTFRNITGGLTLTELRSRQDAGNSQRWLIPYFEYRKKVNFGPRWHTNNYGFRANDIVVPKPTGVYRVACVGGSTTEEGRINETTYPALVEKRLNENTGVPVRVEAINCGVVGMDTMGERRRTMDYVRLQPDLVVEYNGVNDVCHNFFQRWDEEASAYQKWLRNSRFLRMQWPGLFTPADTEIKRRFQEVTLNNLQLMADAFQKRNIKMAVCSFAHPDLGSLRQEERDYFEWDFWKNWQGRHFGFKTYCHIIDIYNELVRQFCAQNKLLYIPVGEELKGGTVYFGDICHLRPKGIEKKAEIIARYVRESIQQP